MHETPITTEPAFGAYLSLGRPEGRGRAAVEHFERTFMGVFPSTHAFLHEYLAARGADVALERFRRTEHLPTQWLTWDEEAVLAALSSRLEVVESGGQTYVFAK